MNRFAAPPREMLRGPQRRLAQWMLGGLAGALLLGGVGCGEDEPHAVDPATVTLPREIRYIDVAGEVGALRGMAAPSDTVEAAAALAALTSGWGTFAPVYLEDILALGRVDSAGTYNEILRFVNFPDIAETTAAIDTTSRLAIPAAQALLDGGLRRLAHHFPSRPVPDVVWMNSAFNYAVFPTPDHLAVGLDWFLGPQHEIVGQLASEIFPGYMRERMHPRYLGSDALRGHVLVGFSKDYYRTDRCVDEMLYWGKCLYLLTAIAPEVADRDWLNWTEAQWDWAQTHEREVWLELSPQEVLFDTQRSEFGRWFVEGPFTRAGNIPQESPDRLGCWVGWQIVSDYMARNPEVTLAELMDMTASDPFLKAYKPGN